MPDLLQSIENLGKGRQLDTSQDKMYPVFPSYEPTTDKSVNGEAIPIPLGDITDPVSTFATFLSPLLKAFAARELAYTPQLGRGLGNMKGGIPPSPEGESTLDALKRLFLERGGVESGEGKLIQGRALNKETLAQDLTSKNITGNSTLNPVTGTYEPISSLDKAFNFLGSLPDKYKPGVDFLHRANIHPEDMAYLFQDKNFLGFLDTLQGISSKGLKNPKTLEKFIENYAPEISGRSDAIIPHATGNFTLSDLTMQDILKSVTKSSLNMKAKGAYSDPAFAESAIQAAKERGVNLAEFNKASDTLFREYPKTKTRELSRPQLDRYLRGDTLPATSIDEALQSKLIEPIGNGRYRLTSKGLGYQFIDMLKTTFKK